VNAAVESDHMSREHIETIKSEISKIIGPIGKFMVEKQIKVMGYTEEEFPEEKIPDLIEKVIEIGVYDSQMAKNLKQKLREKTIAGET
jgi:hypothetical protein